MVFLWTIKELSLIRCSTAFRKYFVVKCSWRTQQHMRCTSRLIRVVNKLQDGRVGGMMSLFAKQAAGWQSVCIKFS